MPCTAQPSVVDWRNLTRVSPRTLWEIAFEWQPVTSVRFPTMRMHASCQGKLRDMVAGPRTKDSSKRLDPNS